MKCATCGHKMIDLGIMEWNIENEKSRLFFCDDCGMTYREVWTALEDDDLRSMLSIYDDNPKIKKYLDKLKQGMVVDKL